MLYVVVSVKDRAVEAFGRPAFFQAVGQAIRSFQDEVNRQADDNVMYKHPDDHDLYQLGTFDDSNGRFDLIEPKMLCLGKQVRI